MPFSSNISPEKTTFLSANYGLSPEHIKSFAEAFTTAYYQMAGEIEYSWEESGWTPEDPQAALVECLTDADRLEPFMTGYMDWCFDFVYKQELVYDLMAETPPRHLREYLEQQGKTWWTASR